MGFNLRDPCPENVATVSSYAAESGCIPGKETQLTQPCKKDAVCVSPLSKERILSRPREHGQRMWWAE